MVGTAPGGKGGIAAVVRTYEEHGVFASRRVRYLPSHQDGPPLGKFLRLASSLVQFLWLLLTRRVALLHLHTASRTSFYRKSLFALLAVLARRPYVLHLHGGGFLRFFADESGLWSRRYIRWVFDRARVVLVLSQGWAAAIRQVTQNPRVRVLPNPVVVPRQTASPNAGKRLVFLGRVEAEKGVAELIQAVSRLGAAHPEVELVLAGDQPAEWAEAYARSLGVDGRLRFVGWVTGERKAAVFYEANVFVLPSYHEGLPMSLLEAMAWGLPVVATAVGGIPDVVVQGRHGYLVPPRDTQALTLALDRLLSDPAARRAMGAAGREYVRANLAVEVIASRLDDIYRDLGA